MSFLHRSHAKIILFPQLQNLANANTAKLKAEFKTKKPRTENYPTVFHSKIEILMPHFIITSFV